MGNNYDPVTLHKYLYANADPGNVIDPSGRFGLPSLGTTLNILGNMMLRVSTVGRSFISRAAFTAGRAPTATSNAVRWGFWRDLPKTVIGGRTYADIGGRAYTRHAVEYMAPKSLKFAGAKEARGITPTMVSHVLRFGKLLGKYRKSINAKGGTGYIRETYILDGIRVVTEAGNRIVVTVVRLK
jgi:hypothetical protein